MDEMWTRISKMAALGDTMAQAMCALSGRVATLEAGQPVADYPAWLTTLPTVARNLQDRIRQLEAGQPTTVSPTTDSPSGAPAQGFTPPPTRASSPSDQDAMPTGPAEQPSGCAHKKRNEMTFWSGGQPSSIHWTCRDCGASLSFVATRVQVAQTTSSTSPSEAAKSSAESPAEAPAESPSSRSSELRGVPQVYHMDIVDADHVRLTPVAW